MMRKYYYSVWIHAEGKAIAMEGGTTNWGKKSRRASLCEFPPSLRARSDLNTITTDLDSLDGDHSVNETHSNSSHLIPAPTDLVLDWDWDSRRRKDTGSLGYLCA
jgi:hypothetical protein